MNKNGLILKRVRQEKNIPLKKAANLIGKSAGWLSEVENSKGMAKIPESEFERIMEFYGGSDYKRKFGTWIRDGYSPETKSKAANEIGQILKHLRLKSNMTMKGAARKSGLSVWTIYRLENGLTKAGVSFQKTLCQAYGYQFESFENYLKPHQLKNSIPSIFKIKSAVKTLSEVQLKELWILIEKNFLHQNTNELRGDL